MVWPRAPSPLALARCRLSLPFALLRHLIFLKLDSGDFVQAGSSPLSNVTRLEISKPHYEYHVQDILTDAARSRPDRRQSKQDQNIIGASHFTLTTSSLGEGLALACQLA